MSTTEREIPNDVAALKKLVRELADEYRLFQEKVDILTDRLFGRRSEKPARGTPRRLSSCR